MATIAQNNQHSASNNEVLRAVNDLSVKFDGLAEKTQSQIDEVLKVIKKFVSDTHQEFSNIKNEITGIKGEITGIDQRLGRVESTMVTKDYLDDKMSDLRGDMVVMMRKGDDKLKTLVGVLRDKEVIDSSDVKKIYSLEPFAQ